MRGPQWICDILGHSEKLGGFAVKRIAVLTLNPPDSAGGVERVTYYLKSVVEDEDTEVEVLHRGLLPSQEVPAVYRRLGLAEVYLTYRISRLFLQRCQKKGDYDLVISNQIAGWPIRDRKAINIFHGTLARYSEILKDTQSHWDFLQTRYIRSQFERLSGDRKTVVAVSNQVAREVKEAYRLQAREVIYNGVDTDHFRRSESSNLKDKLGIDEDTFLGLFTGRHEYAKGFDVLLQISKGLPDDVVLATVGNGYEKYRSERIRYMGPKTYEELPDAYSGADFFIFPSRYEGCPLAPLEAMACGLPVVMSNISIGKEVLKKHEILGGFVIDTFNPSDYIERIVELTSSPLTLSRARGESRRLACDSFSLQKFGERYRTLISSLIDGE